MEILQVGAGPITSHGKIAWLRDSFGQREGNSGVSWEQIGDSLGQLGGNFGYWGNLEAVSRAEHIKQCNQCSVLRKLSKNVAANVQFVENFRNAAAKKIKK